MLQSFPTTRERCQGDTGGKSGVSFGDVGFAVALACGLTTELTADVKRTAQHGFDAICRWVAANKATGATRPRLA
ncbi:hypothetical protein HFN98_28845 [Rhizobium laguerreae]|nr:hypothetical protein [Rhizobium laguerreae]MBY3334587.1 hypothetical protein [Rhizobium laguerreae]